MSKALLWLIDGGFKVIEPQQAVEIWNCTNGLAEPTELQAQFIPKIRDVFIPPSYHAQASGYAEAHKHAKATAINKTPLKLDVRAVDDENSPPSSGLPRLHRAETTALRPDPAQAAIANGTDWQNN
jgi:hypothetical protein